MSLVPDKWTARNVGGGEIGDPSLDWEVTCGAGRYIDHVTAHGNGTVIVTIKQVKS